MSMNLVLTDVSDDGPKLQIVRFGAGITSSAVVNQGDWITFGDTDIHANVVEINHRWEGPNSLIAPISTIRCVVNRFLTEEQWDKLRELGFKNLPELTK